jgi:hypothetical protein
MIIDIHTHLGDILNPGGGNLIDQKRGAEKAYLRCRDSVRNALPSEYFGLL